MFRPLWVLLSLALLPGLTLASAPGYDQSCGQTVAIRCPRGYVDGCYRKVQGGSLKGTSLTEVHACVPATADSRGAIGCEMEIAAVCNDGEQDGCLFKPAVSRSHVCVLIPNP